jgi:hypothetical protein
MHSNIPNTSISTRQSWYNYLLANSKKQENGLKLNPYILSQMNMPQNMFWM